jgi:hypothetical protein
MITAVVGTSTVQLRTEDTSGNPSTPTTVTVTGTADDGTTVLLSAVTIGGGGAGVHTASMTVAQPTLVTLTWTVDGTAVLVDPVDVIGRMPITVGELRASDPTLTSKTADQLRDAIELAHDECRRITGRSWVRRYDVARFETRGDRLITHFADIARVGRLTLDDTVWSASQLADIDIVPLTGTLDLGPVTDGLEAVVGVEHGVREPTAQVRFALLARARYFAMQSSSALPFFSERVSVSDAFTTTRLLPSAQSTGVAEVDAIYRAVAVAGMAGIA